MKKIILMAFLAAGAAFTSCSKDDNSGEEQDQIIGTWLIVETSRTEDGQTTKDELSECYKKSGSSFTADGSFESNSYYLEDSDCVLDDTSKTIGKWENLGDDVYMTDVDGKTSEQKIKFSNNTFSTSSKDGDITYVTVYQKQ